MISNAIKKELERLQITSRHEALFYTKLLLNRGFCYAYVHDQDYERLKSGEAVAIKIGLSLKDPIKRM